MADVVNLRLARKRKMQAASQKLAAEDRTRFGTSRQAKEAERAVRESDARRLDGHRRENGGGGDDDRT